MNLEARLLFGREDIQAPEPEDLISSHREKLQLLVQNQDLVDWLWLLDVVLCCAGLIEIVEILLDVARLKAPGDQGAIMGSCVDEIILWTVHDAHHVFAMAWQIILRKDFPRLFDVFFVFAVSPDMNLSIPANRYDVRYLRIFFETYLSYLSVNFSPTFAGRVQLRQALAIAEVPDLDAAIFPSCD